MAIINMEYFYKGYSNEEMEMIKKIIESSLSDVNDDNILEVINKLSDISYNKYPEIQFYRVNLLIRAGKINKAYRVASNYYKFEPLRIISLELADKINSLEDDRLALVDEITKEFIDVFTEVKYDIARNEIVELPYEDIIELKKFLSDIIKLDDNTVLEYLKNPETNRFTFLQYYRIKVLLRNKKEKKAQNLLKTLNKPLFKFVYKSGNKVKTEIQEEIIESKEEEVSIKQEEVIEAPQIEIIEDVQSEKEEFDSKEDNLLIETDSNLRKELDDNGEYIVYDKQVLVDLITKLYVDNIKFEEIDNAVCANFLKNILKLAFYEKYNRKKGEVFLKKLIRYYKEKMRTDKVKILNSLMVRFTGKLKFFDLELYERLLKAGVDFSNLDKYRKKVEIKEEIPKEIVKKEKISVVKREEKKPKYVTSTVSIVPQTVKKANKIKLEKKVREVTIKDALYEDVLQVQFALYREMGKPERQREAIKAWDIFESMISKSVNDEEALKKVIDFFKRVDSRFLSNNEGINFPLDYTKKFDFLKK